MGAGFAITSDPFTPAFELMFAPSTSDGRASWSNATAASEVEALPKVSATAEARNVRTSPAVGGNGTDPPGRSATASIAAAVSNFGHARRNRPFDPYTSAVVTFPFTANTTPTTPGRA